VEQTLNVDCEITDLDKRDELARIRERASHDEASAIKSALDSTVKFRDAEITYKDAHIAYNNAQIAYYNAIITYQHSQITYKKCK
jgi:hypothetical protein